MISTLHALAALLAISVTVSASWPQYADTTVVPSSQLQLPAGYKWLEIQLTLMKIGGATPQLTEEQWMELQAVMDEDDFDNLSEMIYGGFNTAFPFDLTTVTPIQHFDDVSLGALLNAEDFDGELIDSEDYGSGMLEIVVEMEEDYFDDKEADEVYYEEYYEDEYDEEDEDEYEEEYEEYEEEDEDEYGEGYDDEYEEEEAYEDELEHEEYEEYEEELEQEEELEELWEDEEAYEEDEEKYEEYEDEEELFGGESAGSEEYSEEEELEEIFGGLSSEEIDEELFEELYGEEPEMEETPLYEYEMTTHDAMSWALMKAFGNVGGRDSSIRPFVSRFHHEKRSRWMLIGLPIIGGVVLLLLILGVVCACRKRGQHSDYRKFQDAGELYIDEKKIPQV